MAQPPVPPFDHIFIVIMENHGSLLVITWDENDNAPGNQVATLVIANGVPAGFRSAVAYNHYSLLRTIELAWELAPLTDHDADAAVMSDFFASS
jgi:phosphatidylinositol-3-phosphatase